MKPWQIEYPVRMEIDLMQALYADIASDIPGVERVSGRTIAYTGKDMLEVTKILRLAGNSFLGEFFL